MFVPKQIALIGPTASGKSALAIKMAQKHNAYIFSIDSLSVYRGIDIASAKPTQKEQAGVVHFGIDALYVNEYFSAHIAATLYEDAYLQAQQNSKNLIIVGGTSFYLKSLLTGLSKLPSFSPETLEKTAQLMNDTKSAYAFLEHIDAISAQRIASNDRFRLEKYLRIYFQTNMPASSYFQNNPPKPVISALTTAHIDIDRVLLRTRVEMRTKEMLDNHLIDEVSTLEHTYGRTPNAMRAIGIKETLDYLDGVLTKDALFDTIVTHTMQLAKRQNTFNTGQFKSLFVGGIDEVAHFMDDFFTT